LSTELINSNKEYFLTRIFLKNEEEEEKRIDGRLSKKLNLSIFREEKTFTKSSSIDSKTYDFFRKNEEEKLC